MSFNSNFELTICIKQTHMALDRFLRSDSFEISTSQKTTPTQTTDKLSRNSQTSGSKHKHLNRTRESRFCAELRKRSIRDDGQRETVCDTGGSDEVLQTIGKLDVYSGYGFMNENGA